MKDRLDKAFEHAHENGLVFILLATVSAQVTKAAEHALESDWHVEAVWYDSAFNETKMLLKWTP